MLLLYDYSVSPVSSFAEEKPLDSLNLWQLSPVGPVWLNEMLLDVEGCGGGVQVWTHQQFLFLAA